jgi:hypothetical protein
MIEQTVIQLKQLRLSAMANALISQTEQPGTLNRPGIVGGSYS